jgi:hypothetical protein
MSRGLAMCKTKGFITGAKLLALVVILGSVSLACGAKPEQVPSTPPQLTEETPPAPTETGIPANYTTYTDESNLFSISYPADWETAWSALEKINKNVKGTVANLKAGIPVEKDTLIFFAGRLTAAGYGPSVNVGIEPVPAGISTLDQLVEAETRVAKIGMRDYREISRVKTEVDGNEAIIIENDGTFPGFGIKKHYLGMITMIDGTVWTVTCTGLPENYSEWEDDFNIIVRSLRISN